MLGVSHLEASQGFLLIIHLLQSTTHLGHRVSNSSKVNIC